MNDARESGNPPQSPADAFANLRERFGAYFDAIPDVDAFVREQRGGAPAAPASPYTLTPWPQSVDARLARYEAALSRLTEANEYLTRRVEALEADGRTYRAALDAQGDALQLLTLRGKP